MSGYIYDIFIAWPHLKVFKFPLNSKNKIVSHGSLIHVFSKFGTLCFVRWSKRIPDIKKSNFKNYLNKPNVSSK